MPLSGTGNLVPVTTQSSMSYSQLPDDVLQFYQDAGVDSIAREVTIHKWFVTSPYLQSSYLFLTVNDNAIMSCVIN